MAMDEKGPAQHQGWKHTDTRDNTAAAGTPAPGNSQTQRDVPCDSTDGTGPEKAKLQGQRVGLWLPGAGGRAGQGRERGE